MFYIIRNSTNNTIGNTYPQIQTLEGGYPRGHQNSQRDLSLAYLPDHEIIFPTFILDPRAKLTDLLSEPGCVGGYGLLVSQKFMALLKSFNLASNRIYPVQVRAKNRIHNYFWLQFLPSNSFIDFTRSVIHELNSSGEFVKSIDTKDSQQLINNYKSKSWFNLFKGRNIFLNTEYNQQPLDLFSFYGLDEGIFISQRLHDELVLFGISGIELRSHPYLSS